VSAPLAGDATAVWVPRALAGLAPVARMVPRPVWRRLPW